MEPMRRHGDPLTGYEDGIIEDSDLLSPPTLDRIAYGVTLAWEPISAFVEVANSNAVAIDPPAWMTQPRGQITEAGFKSDVMSCLLQVAGGLAGENDLAPNTFLQNCSVMNRLGHIEADPFVQACMAELDPDACFAGILVLHGRLALGAQPAHLSGPPSPSRRVFY